MSTRARDQVLVDPPRESPVDRQLRRDGRWWLVAMLLLTVLAFWWAR
jgi:hypothetical protein